MLVYLYLCLLQSLYQLVHLSLCLYVLLYQCSIYWVSLASIVPLLEHWGYYVYPGVVVAIYSVMVIVVVVICIVVVNERCIEIVVANINAINSRIIVIFIVIVVIIPIKYLIIIFISISLQSFIVIIIIQQLTYINRLGLIKFLLRLCLWQQSLLYYWRKMTLSLDLCLFPPC